MTTLFLFLTLMIISGIFGRAGGAGKHGHWYDGILDTKWRDCGCSVILVGVLIMLYGWKPAQWWAYLAVFGLTWASFCTYWDSIPFNKGVDNFWMSGFFVGLAAFPAYWLGVPWWLIATRTILLCLSWGLLNKYLQKKILIWNRDVTEEFCRYALSL